MLRPGLPRWKELADDEIDVDYHLRHSAVPSPGGERELGYTGCRDTVPSLQRIAVYTGEALDELEEALGR